MHLNDLPESSRFVEPLETRRLLSSVVIMHETLLITGTNGADAITLQMDPADPLHRNMLVRIGDTSKTVDTAKFGRIRISGQGGNDAIQIDETNGTIVMPLTVLGGGGNDVLIGGSGDDVLIGGAGQDTLVGTNGNDLLTGGDGSDVLMGDSGNDSLLGGAGLDYLDGGDGNDRLDGGNGDDTLLGNAGNDQLFGRNGPDLLLGGDGTDLLDGGNGSDNLSGGSGHDTVLGGAGRDRFDSSDDATEVGDKRPNDAY